MKIEFSLITGMMVGFEGYFDPEEDFDYLILDFFLLRVVISWEKTIDDALFN